MRQTGGDLALEEHQSELRRAAETMLDRRCDLHAVRAIEASELGYSEDVWSEWAALGWLGITLPAERGGAGAPLMDLYPLYLALGYRLTPLPHLASVVVAGETLAAGGGRGFHELVDEIVQGTKIVSPAVTEPGGVFGPQGVRLRATRRGDEWILDGSKILVPYAHVADSLLVVASTPGVGAGTSLFLVGADAPGVEVERSANIAGEPLHTVRFDGAVCAASEQVGPAGHGWEAIEPALDRAAVLRCAQIVGAGERVLEMTTAYAKERRQYGSPIGKYQAVQILCTDIAVQSHVADLFARQAGRAIDGGEDARRYVSMAKAYASEAAHVVMHAAHEVHAGVAFMVDCDVQLYMRRAKHWELDLGTKDYHLARLVDATVGR